MAWRKSIALSIVLLLLTVVGVIYYINLQAKSKAADSLLWEKSQQFQASKKLTTAADEPLAKLGRAFFSETAFSQNGQISCASCHNPEAQFADGLKLGLALGQVKRNTPSIVNSAQLRWLFWDGRSDSLESQALEPIETLLEHGITRAHVINVIVDKYKSVWERTFGAISPIILRGVPLPPALPRPIKIDLSKTVLSRVMASMSDSDLLLRYNDASSSSGLPIEAVIAESLQVKSYYPESWYQTYETMDPKSRQEMDRMFIQFGMAIAAFERRIVAVDSPFDRFLAGWKKGDGVEEAVTKGFGYDEVEGLRLFTGKANCTFCHSGPFFSDGEFHNIGLAGVPGQLELGRARGVPLVTNGSFRCQVIGVLRPELLTSETCQMLKYLDPDNLDILGAFKTPGLRNVELTGPYFHDGRAASLDEVIDHYNLLTAKAAIGHQEEILVPLNLTDKEKKQLIAFLNSLTSPVEVILSSDP